MVATLIKVKEHTKARLKKLAIGKFGREIGTDMTYDTIISLLLKEAEKRGFDFAKLIKSLERGVD